MTRRPPHPYARRHLATHAAAGGTLDDVLDLENLPYLDQARLSSLLRLAEAAPHTHLWVLLSAWRSIRHRWSWDDVDANAAALDVAYRAVGGWGTPERPTTSGLAWRPQWVEWNSGGTIAAGEGRGRVRVALGRPHGLPTLATVDGFRVELWDPATGQAIGEPLHPPGQIRALTISDERGVVVAACQGGLVAVWDVVTRLLIRELEIPEERPRALAVGTLHDRWVVAVGGAAGVLHIRSLDGDTAEDVPTGAPVRDVALANLDGRLYAAMGGGDGLVRVHDVTAGAPTPVVVPLGHEINAVAFEVQGDRLVLAAGSADGTARLWEGRTGAVLSDPLEHGGEVRSVALTATGGDPLLATGSSDSTARVWYVAGGGSATEPLSHPAPVESVAFGEIDGRTMLATGCLDGNVRLWDPVRPSAARVPATGWLPSVDISAGLVVAGVEGGSVRLWDRADGLPFPEFPVTPGDEPLEKTLRGPGVDVRLGVVAGRGILVTLHRGRASAWDLSDPSAPVLAGTTPLRTPSTHDAAVTGAAALVASMDMIGMVEVLDLLSGPVPLLPYVPEPTTLGFVPSPDGTLLAVQNGAGLHLFDTGTGERLHHLLPIALPRRSAVGRLDGVEVLAALDPGRLQLYDLSSGEPTLPPLEMSGTATGVAWVNVAGRELLVTAHAMTVRIWNPRTGRKVSELPFGTEIAGIAVHPTADEAVVVAVSGPGIALVELREA
jgi:WD40 repeat protein